MRRKEIREIEAVLEQIEGLERMLRDLEVEAKHCWWKIQTPKREINLNFDNTRHNFIIWVRNEIESLKESISLED